MYFWTQEGPPFLVEQGAEGIETEAPPAAVQ